MLGHSSITITSDTYTSVLPEVARKAAEAAVRLVPRQAARTAGLTSGSHQANGRPGHSKAPHPKKSDGALSSRSEEGSSASRAVGRVGLEPTTNGLKVRCSAN